MGGNCLGIPREMGGDLNSIMDCVGHVGAQGHSSQSSVLKATGSSSDFRKVPSTRMIFLAEAFNGAYHCLLENSGGPRWHGLEAKQRYVCCCATYDWHLDILRGNGPLQK